MKIQDIKSNSPIQHIPDDYCPEGDYFWFTLKKGLDKGKKMFYRKSHILGSNPDECIVFVHGNPECSYTYRNIIKNIINNTKKACQIISMDHIGFGLSDQASYEMVCMDHAENLFQLIKHLNLQKVTLIVHDWGGPIGIGTFLREPERVSNLILLNTTVFPIPKTGLTFQNYPISWLGWCYTPYIIPDKFWGDFAAYAIFTNPNKPLPLLTNMVKNIALMELELYQKTHTIAQRVFKEQFYSKMNVRSSKRLVMQTKMWGYGNLYKDPKLGKRDTEPFYKMIQDKIRSSWGPDGHNIGVSAIIGGWDPLGKTGVISQWTENIPQLKGNVQYFKNIGHFIEEHKYREIAGEIMRLANLSD
ncbi:MAG: Haloalkane dehalogenase [Promethearchaeota archaeon]|jgi:pimeloyl-ACP methyl ester carboxylesterase|nr:MAG: Haloalkane dehalogenase [Candidatus Lokiarchaeota archaeon]